MPELPEVETIVRELKACVIGKKFWKFEGKLANVIKPLPQEVAAKLVGLHIENVTRRGKFIIFELDKNMCLIIHLRMTGRLLWKKVRDKEKFIRAIFTFSDGTQLIFSDVRKFGRIWLYSKNEYPEATGISRLGFEPLNQTFTLQKLIDLFYQKKGILKNTLLRQDLIAGIGNIYADEICHRIQLHPSSRLEKLTKKDLSKMYEAIQFCLGEGIKHCGVSVSDFVGTRGMLGKHQKYLQVYGRKGDACYRCTLPIQKTVVAGRGTFYCEKCQRKA